MIERTLVLVNSDGFVRCLVGEIISRFERRGLKIVGMKMIWPDKEFAKKHYRDDIAERYGVQVRELLLRYITEAPVLALVLEGVSAVNVVRKIVGSTYPHDAPVGTIRGDFAHVSKDYADLKGKDVRNLVHASGSKGEAEIEVGLWFSDAELFGYHTVHDTHII